MSLPDPTASAALSDSVVKPVFFVFLDIDGGQVRANTSGANVTPTGTGFPEMDDEEFIGISASFVDITPVRYAPGGSQSVTATLSGIPTVDDETLALMGDKANWRGRDARLWRIIRNAMNVQQGGFYAYYTGKMTAFSHSGDADGHILKITIESYLSVFSEASNRTYMDQGRYDAGDLSPQAAVAIANGNFDGTLGVPGSYTSDGGGSGSWANLRAKAK